VPGLKFGFLFGRKAKFNNLIKSKFVKNQMVRTIADLAQGGGGGAGGGSGGARGSPMSMPSNYNTDWK
jgi:hypothetical protein